MQYNLIQCHSRRSAMYIRSISDLDGDCFPGHLWVDSCGYAKLGSSVVHYYEAYLSRRVRRPSQTYKKRPDIAQDDPGPLQVNELFYTFILNPSTMLRSALVFLGLASSTLALVYGVDNSVYVPEATYAKAKGEGFTKVIIRGHEEACGVGGEVDPNFVPSYNNARAAGITNIDTYWFPCTGSHHNCKPFGTQIAELGAVFNAHRMNIGTIWIDLEYDPVCNNWNYGASGNLAVAREVIAAIKASGYNFGIYSSPGEWSRMFGSYSVILDNAAPLWFATYDGIQSLNLRTPFGGWTSAVGKQYTDHSASGLFDLNVFAH